MKLIYSQSLFILIMIIAGAIATAAQTSAPNKRVPSVGRRVFEKPALRRGYP